MAGLAAVREVQPGGQRSVQHAVAGLRFDDSALGLDADLHRRECTRCLDRSFKLANVVFQNPAPAAIRELLTRARVIAVVGLSDNPQRPSYGVARSMQSLGYRIIPVTPAADSVLGERSIAQLSQLPEVLKAGERVDIVDVFRKSEHVSAIVDECIRLKLPALWLQDGVIDDAAAARAQAAGIFTVMDRCIWRDRAQMER